MTQYSILKNTEQRPFCWIVGSGTSLDEIDISKIHGDPIFALNAAITICLSEDPELNKNCYWVFNNKKAFYESKDRLPEKPKRIYTRIENIGATKDLSDKNGQIIGLNEANGEGTSKHTVATRAARIARFLGYRNAFLLGIDCVPNEQGEVYAKSLRFTRAIYKSPEKQFVYFNNFIADWQIVKNEINDMNIYSCSPLLDKSLFRYIEYNTALFLRSVL